MCLVDATEFDTTDMAAYQLPDKALPCTQDAHGAHISIENSRPPQLEFPSKWDSLRLVNCLYRPPSLQNQKTIALSMN
jgi:hypothetical protein